jgi:Xaa-Pro aminopeptidase
MLEFETLTLAPIDRNLIDVAMLTPAERHWVDAYHSRVYETLCDRLDTPARDWLMAAAAPL